MKKLFLIATLLFYSVSYGQRCVGNCTNGQGTYTWADGKKYVGSWRDDKQSGQGTHTWPSGQKYVGSWRDGDYQEGTMIYENGQKFVGSWRDGKRNGQGTYTFLSGEKYDGSWKDGDYHGQGTLTYANGNIKKSGIWKNDTYIGTQAQVQAKERERIARENRERQVREEEKKKYEKIYNACLIDKSAGVDMQVSSLRRAVEETCAATADDPSWYDEIKYFKL